MKVNAETLAATCLKHRDEIVERFERWRVVPPENRNDQRKVALHVQVVMAIAQTFATRLNDPSLLASLHGDSTSNPLIQWELKLKEAAALAEQLRYDEARTLLTDLLIDVRGLQGTGVEQKLPVTHGLLGNCVLHSGDAAAAVGHYQTALRLCEKAGDAEGVLTYNSSLYEAHRYLGEREAASDYAIRVADLLARYGRTADVARFRRQAKLVMAGEPLNRAVIYIGDVRYEVEEVPRQVQGVLKIFYERNRIALQLGEGLTQQAIEKASAGEYDEAVALFERASAVDRYHPHPHYGRGLALLRLGRYEEAAESYEAAERLAPGWFICRSDLWVARQLAAGALPHEAFEVLRVLEDSRQEAGEKLELAERGLGAFANMPHLHFHRGLNLMALKREADAERAFRAGLGMDPEVDVKTRLLLNLALSVASRDEKLTLIREAVMLNGNLSAGAMAKVQLVLMEG